MKKNLFFITILILFSFTCNATDSLPPLPLPEASSVTVESISGADNRSTWQKIKIFFWDG